MAVAALSGLGLVLATQPSGAAEAPVGLGTAASFAVLAGAGVTNTGTSVINGNLGSCPTPAISGFGPGVVNGQIYGNTAEACAAQSDLTIAYNDAAGRAPNTTYPAAQELGGLVLVPGVYKTATSFAITGALTLNAQGDAGAVFIFQAGSTLTTAVNSSVQLINGAQACNVYWQVGSSATLGVGSTFIGTILALSDITANTSATVQGRLLARNGAVTLDTNTVSVPQCAPPPTTTTVAVTSTTTVAPTTTVAEATTTTVAPVATSTTAAPAVTTTTLPAAVAANSATTTSLPDGPGLAVGTGSAGAGAGTGAAPRATTAGAGRALATGTSGSGAGSGSTVFGTTATAGGGGSTTSLTGAGAGGSATSMASGSAAGAGEPEALARTGSRLWSETLLGLLAVAVGLLMMSVAGQGPVNPPWRRPVRPTPWVGPVRPPFLLLNEPAKPEK